MCNINIILLAIAPNYIIEKCISELGIQFGYLLIKICFNFTNTFEF